MGRRKKVLRPAGYRVVRVMTDELRVVIVLFGLILGFLVIGKWAPNVIRDGGLTRSGFRTEQTTPKNEFGLNWWLYLWSKLDVPSKQPWELGDSDMTTRRVVYNMLTKPGFRQLWANLMLVILATGLLLKVVNGLQKLSEGGGKNKAASKASKESLGVVVRIQGTVPINRGGGVIYLSSATMPSGENRYGLYVPQIRLLLVMG